MPFQISPIIDSKFRLYTTPEHFFLIPFSHDGRFWNLLPEITWSCLFQKESLNPLLVDAIRGSFFPKKTAKIYTLREIETIATGFYNVTCYHNQLTTGFFFTKRKGFQKTTFAENVDYNFTLSPTSIESLSARLLTLVA